MKRTGRISLTRLAIGLTLTGLAVGLVAGPAGAATTVSGTVGPGFTISVKKSGKKVKRLKAGTYRFRISDKSAIHNFRLKGPGYNKAITSVGFKGTKTVTVKLKKGTWRFVCDPHASSMKGSFKVN
jgi:plastocyanin